MPLKNIDGQHLPTPSRRGISHSHTPERNNWPDTQVAYETNN